MDKKLLHNVTRIITHDNCADGIISAAIIRQVLPRVSVEFYQYNTPQVDNLRITYGMLFVDFTPPEHLVDACLGACAIVLDHHKGQEETVRRFGERGVFADEKIEPGVSGATLAFREVFEPLYESPACDAQAENIERLAYLIGVRDTWLTVSRTWPEACAISAAVRNLGPDYWLAHGPFLEEWHLQIGEACLRQQKTQVHAVLKRLYLFEYNGIRVAVYSDGSGTISDAAEEICSRNIADVVCGFIYVKNEGQANHEMTVVYSLRSNGKFDVAAFAKQCGGGGHTKAAGFSVQTDFTVDAHTMFRDVFTKHKQPCA